MRTPAALFLAVACSTLVFSQASLGDPPRGQIVDGVKCAADATQTYALYLPSNYSPAKRWNLMLAFDPGGRGRRPVERYRAAAEKYGYIVAGSNNSHNGPYEVSRAAAQAMWTDVLKRFSIDTSRIYAAGHSGGARVAMSIAMEAAGVPGYDEGTKHPGSIAGVLASSAFYPENQPLESLKFPVFGTAGTEDFNNLEMHQFDRAITTPHRTEIFEGPHTWLPEPLAIQAVEWMELQAMKTGLRKRDNAWLNDRFSAWLKEASKQDAASQIHTLTELAADFAGLHELAPLHALEAELRKQPGFEDSLQRARADERTEATMLGAIEDLEAGLDSNHSVSIAGLRERLTALSQQARSQEDSALRRMARRILSGVTASSGGNPYQDFLDLIATVRLPQTGDR